MTIKEVVTAFQREKQEAVASRFPCRAIMVKNIKQYRELLSELKKISDIRVVQTSELFSNADVMPCFDNLKNPKYQNQWVILTGISEYLRLFSKKEQTDRRFANLWSYQAPASSTGRIIIPLWGCEAQWFDSALNFMGDLRQQDFYYDCSDLDAQEQILTLTILSGVFEKYIAKLNAMKGNLKVGLQEWFDYWTDPSADEQSFVLLTKRCNSIVTTNGNVSIHVISDTMAFIKEHMPGAEILTADNCTTDMQNVLLDYSLKGTSLDEALLKILNVSVFSGADIMGKWKNMPISHKQFVSLWLSMHPDGSYTNHCFKIAKSINDVPDAIMLEIFKVRQDNPEWVDEYHQLMSALSIEPDERFFNELDKIPVYETRMDFLNGANRNERIYLIRMVGKWMRMDYEQVISCDKLREIYPELYFYLNHTAYPNDADIKGYLSRYKAHKLENTLPDDEDMYFAGIQTDVYDNRYSILDDNIDGDTAILWIDALGAEWLPLLKWAISENCDGTISFSSIGQANLPTETCYNDLWNNMNTPYIKLDKLDKLAHKGVIDEPDYYTCIEEQIAFVSGIHKHITELFKKYHRVIVTGDHGTSRLAARFFHIKDGFTAPKDATVCSHGRYCKIADGVGYATPNMHIFKCADGLQYMVYTNYDHFKQSGFAAGVDDDNAIYGEVHGGATPEEMLVPVIVIDSNVEIPLAGKWEKPDFKIIMKKARLSLSFNKPVHKLQLKIAGIDAEVTTSDGGKHWNAIVPGIKQGTYTAHVLANNILVDMPEITILPALGGGDGDLP